MRFFKFMFKQLWAVLFLDILMCSAMVLHNNIITALLFAIGNFNLGIWYAFTVIEYNNLKLKEFEKFNEDLYN